MMCSFIGLLGILTILFPEDMIEIFEGVAIENSDENTIKPWISSGIRAEGIIVTAASLIGGRAYVWMMNLTGVFGAVVLLSPQLYRKLATALLYEDPNGVEWNDQFTTGVRIIGVVYILLAVKAFKKHRTTD